MSSGRSDGDAVSFHCGLCDWGGAVGVCDFDVGADGGWLERGGDHDGDLRHDLLDMEFVSWFTIRFRYAGADRTSTIHLYFVLTYLAEAMHGGQTYPMSCPQCQGGSLSFSVGSFQFRKSYNFGAGTKNGYAPLLDEGGEPRASTDDRPSAGEDMV